MPTEPTGPNGAPQGDWEALARYLAGESSAAERASVSQWLTERPADAKVAAALDDALKSLTLGAGTPPGVNVDVALARVNARRQMRVSSGRGRPLFRWAPVAAAAAVVLAVGVSKMRQTKSAEVATIGAQTFATPVGGRDSLVLADGSTVVLGPGSSITLAAGYGEHERAVSLRGEAFFEVKHDAAHPFVVRVNGAEIRDIGTAFAVHSDTGGARVVVTEGRVEVRPSSGAATATLVAGDVGVIPASGAVAVESGARTDDDLAWRRGKLVFHNATLAEVRADLQRWFGIELAVRDSALLRRHLDATFDRSDSVAVVLNVIRIHFGARVERRGDSAILSGKPEGARPE